MGERVETYIARKTFTVGDRVVHEGDSVPEAESWRRPQAWVDSGHLAVVFRDADELAVVEEPEAAPDLSALTVVDLRELAKEAGLTGYSKLGKDKLVQLLTD